MYLIKKKNTAVKHLWNGTDTICRQYSTGGMSIDNYIIVSDEEMLRNPINVPICTMCDRKDKAFKGIKWKS